LGTANDSMDMTKATGQPAETRAHRTAPAYFAGGVGGALPTVAIAGWAGPWLKLLMRDKGFRLGLITVSILAPCVALVAHELGHVLAGWLVGFRFQLLVIGPLRLERAESGRARVGLNLDPALFGGVACSLPTDSRDLIRSFAWFAAGGPAASLAFAALLLLPPALAPGWFGPLPKVALVLTGLFSGALGLATAIPMSMGAFTSDGARVFRLARGGAPAARDAALLHLEALSVGKIHPRDWDDAVVATALVPSDASSGECLARQMAYLVAVDRGDCERAYEHLTRALELIHTFPGSAAPQLAVEAAYFEGLWRGRADEARRWLGRLPASSPFLPIYERLRAEAAAEAAEGETASARARVEDALRLVPAEAVWVRDRLTEMQRRLESST
jgi:hypothetical protein